MATVRKIGFWGAGKMAQGVVAAIAGGGDAACRPRLREIILSSAHENRNVEIAKSCDLVFLAVRPAQVDEVAAEVKPYLRKGQTIVSMVAGKTLKRLRTAFGTKARILRVMPNLALRVGEGMCVLSSHDAEVETILSRAGKVLVLPERHFDAVTALSGSGPAYFAYMQKAMAEGGALLGLPRKAAQLLAAQTMFGTAKFLRESGANIEDFIAGVATKGGTTAAGMRFLDTPIFTRVVAKTLAGAAKRSKELA